MILCVSKINVNKAWIQAKIHAEPATQKSFANQWCRMPTWHGVWRHRETSYRAAMIVGNLRHGTVIPLEIGAVT